MKHTDLSGITAIDWQCVIDKLPPSARAAFEKERAARTERSKRLLDAHKRGEGGLTTYDPDHRGWVEGEELLMVSMARDLERAEFYVRERNLGVVEAAKSIV